MKFKKRRMIVMKLTSRNMPVISVMPNTPSKIRSEIIKEENIDTTCNILQHSHQNILCISLSICGKEDPILYFKK